MNFQKEAFYEETSYSWEKVELFKNNKVVFLFLVVESTVTGPSTPCVWWLETAQVSATTCGKEEAAWHLPS